MCVDRALWLLASAPQRVSHCRAVISFDFGGMAENASTRAGNFARLRLLKGVRSAVLYRIAVRLAASLADGNENEQADQRTENRGLCCGCSVRAPDHVAE